MDRITAERKRCARGHLLQHGCKTYCTTCHNQQLYWKKRVELSMSAVEARARNTENHRAGVARAMRRYRAKWGNPDRDPIDRMLREFGKQLGLADRQQVREHIEKHGVPAE